MTLYFPISPNDGDEHTIGDVTYVWDDTNGVWNAKTTSQGESYTKLEADAKFVDVSGDSMTGALSMGNSRITNLRNPIGTYDAANLYTVELEANKKVDRTGDAMTGPLAMSGNNITYVSDPKDLQDVSTKNYTDTADTALDNKKVDRGGDTMSGNLLLVDSIGTPLNVSNPGHAATKKYVDEEIASSVSSPISYKGLIDASQTGPTSTPVKSGDFYVHENSDNSGDSVVPDPAWGLSEDIDDLDRLLYDGTHWAILHTAGEYVSKVGGDFMEGPLVVRPQQGDQSSRDNNRINTLGVFSAGSSSLQLGYDNQTKVYVGNTNVSFNNPILVNEISPRSTSDGINYTGLSTKPNHLITKGYVDGQFISRIGEFKFNLTGSSFDEGDFMAATTVNGVPSSSPIDPKDVAQFKFSSKDVNGKDVTYSDFGIYIQVTGSQGHQAFYAVVGGSGILGTDVSVNVVHQFGDGFSFDQDAVYVIEPTNELLMTQFFVSKLTPEMLGDVLIKNSQVEQDFKDRPEGDSDIYTFFPSDSGDSLNKLTFKNGASGTQRISIDLQGNTFGNGIQIRGGSGISTTMMLWKADASIECYSDINFNNTATIKGVRDPNNDDEVVSLGYITEALQNKFNELIGQSAQGTFIGSDVPVPGQGKFSSFGAGSNQLNNQQYYYPSDVIDFSFHTIDKDGRNIDFTSLSVGDYIVTTFDGSANLVRYRVEGDPTPHAGGSAVVDIDVSWVSGGESEVSKSANMSIQFQKIGGSADLTDYVKKSGDKMTGTLESDMTTGNFLLFKDKGAQKFKVDANGKTEIQGSLQLNQFINFTGSSNRFIKSGNENRMEFRTETTGGTVRVSHPGNNRSGFSIKGRENGALTSVTGDVFYVFHGSGTEADGANYRGIQTQDENLATMKVVNDKLPLDGSEKMTGNLTIETNGESKIILNGNRNSTTAAFGTLQFQNTAGGGIDYLALRGDDNQSRYFKFTAPVTIARNKGGDNKENVIIEGRPNGSSSTTDKVLSVFTNTQSGGGDAINYFGKTDGSTNIQTKGSIESMFPYKITESGGQFFIEPN